MQSTAETEMAGARLVESHAGRATSARGRAVRRRSACPSHASLPMWWVPSWLCAPALEGFPMTVSYQPAAPAAPLSPVATADPLLARARALEPIIREHAEATERQRRLARPVI